MGRQMPTIVSGRDLPLQLHLGRRCDPSWVSVKDPAADPDWLCIKPMGALWTAPVTSQSTAGTRTAWSDLYYRLGYDLARWSRATRRERLGALGRPERLWPVTPDPARARILRLESVEDIVSAARRWATPHGHISFEAISADGIDAVWVLPSILPRSWFASDWGSPNARLRAQFYGWDVESVAWLSPEHLQVGHPVAVDRSHGEVRPSSVTSAEQREGHTKARQTRGQSGARERWPEAHMGASLGTSNVSSIQF